MDRKRPTKVMATCGKPVAGSTCCLLKYHRGRCARLIARSADAQMDLDLPVPKTGKQVAPPVPDTMTPEQVATVLARGPVFFAWFDAVKIHALELMQKGVVLPGFKAVAKQTRFAWNQGLTAQKIAKTLNLKPDDVQETRTLSPSKVRAKAKGKFKDKVNGLTWRPFAVTIARQGDKRVAIPSTKISFQPIHREEENGDE